jgi:hypothetical protein
MNRPGAGEFNTIAGEFNRTTGDFKMQIMNRPGAGSAIYRK